MDILDSQTPESHLAMSFNQVDMMGKMMIHDIFHDSTHTIHDTKPHKGTPPEDLCQGETQIP